MAPPEPNIGGPDSARKSVFAAMRAWRSNGGKDRETAANYCGRIRLRADGDVRR